MSEDILGHGASGWILDCKWILYGCFSFLSWNCGISMRQEDFFVLFFFLLSKKRW